MAVTTRLLSRIKKELFLDRIITGDEKWICSDNIIHRIQWLLKDQAPLPDPKAIESEKYCVSGGIVLM